jgi:redox-sensitive bicupin YhaK (pirin superfamily)
MTMLDLRPFDSLGKAEFGWLSARHHFSFGGYRDPNRVHVGALRVWNDDRIAPGTGFDPHPHRDMEIITYVRRGAITHRDNMGNEGRTEAGDVQVMSAGTGVVHSEYNLEAEPTEIFQIWIIPDRTGHAPSWGARAFPKGERAGTLVPLASGEARFADQALPIHQDATLYAGTLHAGQIVTHELAPGRKGYLVPATGRITVNGVEIGTRDGLAIEEGGTISITVAEDAEVILVDVIDLK